MTVTEAPEKKAPKRAPDLGPLELLRYLWRQLTSMRTALILLLLLALAAIPGSVVPQEDVDALAVSRWRDQHPTLTPVYDRLGLFSVYDTPWFAAIYLLLVVSLVGCILPRTLVYLRALRAQPPAAPRNLSRLPAYASYEAGLDTARSARGLDQRSVVEPVARDERPSRDHDVLTRAAAELRRRRYRVRVTDEYVAAERGHLRETGNLLFHLSILVVLVGFAMGSLFGYRGGAIVMVGGGFANTKFNYDDYVPGALFDPAGMEPFSFDIDDFDVEWITGGPAAGQARKFVSHLTYQTSPGAEPEEYDLKVNHPLQIGGTEVFLIGHGYAPVITVRDGEGHVAYSGPTVFLPVDQSFRSFGVIKAYLARPGQIGLTGELYPSYAFTDERGPFSYFGDALDPAISMSLYTGDLGQDDGTPTSVYSLDTKQATPVMKSPKRPFLVNLRVGETADLPDGLGSVTFDGLERWNRLQISRQPGKLVALTGVSLALLGLLLSLFVRPRRVWVRVRRHPRGDDPDGEEGTLVEIGGLDRSGSGGTEEEVAAIAAALRGQPT